MLDVANPSIIEDGNSINIIIVIVGVIILIVIVGLVVYFMRKGKVSNEKN